MMNRCPGRMETTGRKEVLLRFKQLRGPNPSDATSATVRIVRGGWALHQSAQQNARQGTRHGTVPLHAIDGTPKRRLNHFEEVGCLNVLIRRQA